MINLRTYQQKAVEDIRTAFAAGQKSVLLVAPTGAGKTVMFSYMALNAYYRQRRTLIVTDRIELLTQAGGTLAKFGIFATKIDAKTKGDPGNLPGRVFVAMAETIKRRIDKSAYIDFLQGFDLVIFDEAHKQTFLKLRPYLLPSQFVIGATATPWRAGKAHPLAKEYEKMVLTAEVSELIELGALVPAVSWGAPIDLKGVHTVAGEYNEKELFEKYNKRELYAGVVEKYQKHAAGTKALVFCVNVQHSKLTAEAFCAAGIAAKHMDADTPPVERAATLAEFGRGVFPVLCNVGLFTTGFDEPTIKTIILNRATKSLALFLQMCGRGSRPSVGKENFTILDMGNNIQEHGFWEQDRADLWAVTFLGKEPKDTPKQPPRVVFCANCGALLAAGTDPCPMCLASLPKPERALIKQEKEAEFVRLEWGEMPERLRGRRFTELAVDELEEVRKLRGYKLGWAIRQLGTVERLSEYAKYKGYKNGFVYKNLHLVK